METSRSDADPFRFSPDPSPEEAAAVIAGIEQFLRDTAVRITPTVPPSASPWKRAALAEGVSRAPERSGF